MDLDEEDFTYGVIGHTYDEVTGRHVPFEDTSYGPQVPGGHYLCDYWRHEYIVDSMYSSVLGRNVWIVARWLPTTDESHPRASSQWRDDPEHTTTHCTRWGEKDIIISQP